MQGLHAGEGVPRPRQLELLLLPGRGRVFAGAGLVQRHGGLRQHAALLHLHLQTGVHRGRPHLRQDMRPALRRQVGWIGYSNVQLSMVYS